MDTLNLEEQARKETTCRGCGTVKELGMVVCWQCFKYRQDVTPLKYFQGEFSDWLRSISYLNN